MNRSDFFRLRWKNRAKRFLGHLHGQEILYAHMFDRMLEARGLECGPFFPIGGAANYSLLYLIGRICLELPVRNVLELGVGQSTILLDVIGMAGQSVEHDAGWAETIRRKAPNREVLTTELVTREIKGCPAQIYNFDVRTAELVIVDGPQGSPRYSRLGALDILDDCLADEYMVIFDDAERKGEQDTILSFARSRNARTHIISGLSSQCVVYTDKFAAVGWY